jgi:hypothetical protein
MPENCSRAAGAKRVLLWIFSEKVRKGEKLRRQNGARDMTKHDGDDPAPVSEEYLRAHTVGELKSLSAPIPVVE